MSHHIHHALKVSNSLDNIVLGLLNGYNRRKEDKKKKEKKAMFGKSAGLTGKNIGDALKAPGAAIKRNPADRVVDLGVGMSTGLATGIINNTIHDNALEHKQEKKEKALQHQKEMDEIKQTLKSLQSNLKPAEVKSASVMGTIKALGGSAREAMVANHHKAVAEAEKAVESFSPLMNSAILDQNFATSGYERAKKVFDATWGHVQQPLSRQQTIEQLKDMGNIESAQKAMLSAGAKVNNLKHEAKGLLATAATAQEELQSARKMTTYLGGAGLLAGTGVAAKEVVKYPSWRRAAIAETAAINAALAKGKPRGLGGLALGALGIGGALAAGAIYNHVTDSSPMPNATGTGHRGGEAYHYVTDMSPATNSPADTAISTLASVHQAKPEEKFAGAGTIKTAEDYAKTSTLTGHASELISTKPGKALLGALGLAAAGYGAHKGVEALGGYEKVTRAVSPETMDKVDALRGRFADPVHPPSGLKSFAGKAALVTAGAAAGIYGAGKLKEKSADPQPKEASQAMHLYRQAHDTLPEGFVPIDEHPEFREEKSANILSTLAEDINSGGKLYEEFLRTKRIAEAKKTTDAAAKAKTLGVGVLAGLAIPTVGRAGAAILSTMQNGMMMNPYMGGQMMGGGYGPKYY